LCFFGEKSADSCDNFYWKTDDIGFDDAFLANVKTQFLANLNVDNTGAVVASRDHNTPAGSYYFHWMRDAALTIKNYMDINDQDYNSIKDIVGNYVKWVQKVQNQSDPQGIDIRVEPKFEIPSGVPNTDPWCRPQSDGPALRSLALSIWGRILIKQGLNSEAETVMALIEKDLDWVTNNWQSLSCDLWEDYQSTDLFWGRSAMVHALLNAADFAGKLGKGELKENWIHSTD